jgi:hypothetical protein
MKVASGRRISERQQNQYGTTYHSLRNTNVIENCCMEVQSLFLQRRLKYINISGALQVYSYLSSQFLSGSEMLCTFIFLNPNQQMAVGTYECTNKVKLAFAGYAKRDTETSRR